jgi:subtilisin-like proprotein convertase family protein
VRTRVLILSGLACVAASPAASASAQTAVGPPVTLPDSASAPASGTPYPSPVTATGEGIVTDVNVRISNFSHDFPDDADILLTGPGGQSTLLLSDAGGSAAATGVDLAFDDEAAGPVTDPLVSGVYRPTDITDPFPDLLPSPAPVAPFGSTLSAFDNTVGDGVWSLYVVDDDAGVGGQLTSWRVSITSRSPNLVGPTPVVPMVTEGPGAVATVTFQRFAGGGAGTVAYATGPALATAGTASPGEDFQPVSGTLSFAPGETAKAFSIPVSDDPGFELDEHFVVTLANAQGDARISSGNSVRVKIRDNDPPSLELRGKRLQRPLRRGAVTVLATASPSSALRATGTIALRRGAKVQLGGVRVYVPYGKPRVLALGLRPGGKRKLSKAFDVQRRLTARLTVTAAVSGRSTVKSVRVELRR